MTVLGAIAKSTDVDVVLPITVTPSQLLEKTVGLYKTGLSPGCSTGWQTLDEYYTVVAGQWTLVTGIPGHGKSEFLDHLLINLAKRDDWRFAVYSPENTPKELHLSKLLEKWQGKPFRLGPTPRMELHEAEK